MPFKIMFRKLLLLQGLLWATTCTYGQSYRKIAGWDDITNQKIESFLNSTLITKERKVAVFDCDGTLFGQSPYYLADEAIYQYAKKNYAPKKDSLSKAKMAIIDSLLHGNNVGTNYLKWRIDFLAGLSPEQIESIGERCFHDKYQTKFFPEMREMLSNLQDYGFEIWVLTASPELLYQQFVHKNLGIPENRILGVKSVVSQGKVTDKMVYPIPQDEGKAEAIQTFIKVQPLFIAGNSRGDLEMMGESTGMKLIVNPDDKKVEKGVHAGEMEGQTVKQYWVKHNGLTVYCNDVPEGSYRYITKEWKVKPNKSNPKL